MRASVVNDLARGLHESRLGHRELGGLVLTQAIPGSVQVK